MESPKTTRKSCDFCYRRKIKCDGQKPCCTHCVTYSMKCTYTAPSRKTTPKKQRSQGEADCSARKTEARFEHLESLLEQLKERLDISTQKSGAQTQSHSPMTSAQVPWEKVSRSHDRHAGHNDTPAKLTNIPPRDEVLHIVQVFLDKFNSVLPLFQAETLLLMVHEFYNLVPRERSPVAYAAINVVIALTYRHAMIGDSETSYALEHLRRAQSVLSAVILGETDLLNIQVLLGMVILLQGSQDHQPPLILIATTMRLVHKIGLHNRASSMYLDPVVARQRTCVFWLAYILDKDTSMRMKQPSIQLDDDIDLDLPSQTAGDYRSVDASRLPTGCITTADGTMEFDFFLSRIQLAIIQGGVYDYLYSTRSQKRSGEERAAALESVVRALNQWKASIPPDFCAAGAVREVPLESLRFLAGLHATSLSCTTLIDRAHAWNDQWVTSLRTSALRGTNPLLPPSWEAVVDEARDLLALFRVLPVADHSNFWITSCTYMSAMMLLTAKAMQKPLDRSSSQDDELVADGLHTVNEMLEESGSESLRWFRDTCTELSLEVRRRREIASTTVNGWNDGIESTSANRDVAAHSSFDL